MMLLNNPIILCYKPSDCEFSRPAFGWFFGFMEGGFSVGHVIVSFENLLEFFRNDWLFPIFWWTILINRIFLLIFLQEINSSSHWKAIWLNCVWIVRIRSTFITDIHKIIWMINMAVILLISNIWPAKNVSSLLEVFSVTFNASEFHLNRLISLHIDISL